MKTSNRQTHTDNPLTLIEEQASKDPSNPVEARGTLRRWLIDRLDSNANTGTMGDALLELARLQNSDRDAAIVVLRCLAIDGLLPESNSKNHIARSVVSICKRTLPDICDYLKVDMNAQSYEVFSHLGLAHKRICSLLDPLAERYGDVDALMNNQKKILGVLNHSIVRAYGNPFGISDIRNSVEGVFSGLKRVANPEVTFLQDFEECKRSIANARVESHDNGTFFAIDFLDPFLNNTEILLSNYVNSVQERFQTKIIGVGSQGIDIQKRYPLHEEGRELLISIPLKNKGPGMATDVRVEVVTSDENVYFPATTVSLGHVLPGDFSVVLDAMVIIPSSGLQGVLDVEWGELGNPERQSEAFDFSIVAQSSNIDWSKLAYWTPYSTDVAGGDQFIGREDKVKLLASKYLRSPMEPFFVTGQKRVGKTSLALAAADFAVANAPNDEVAYHYILWGDVAHTNPSNSVRQIGENIDAFIRTRLPSGVQSDSCNYDGTLTPLVGLSDLALQLSPLQKFVIIIDEFDEIPQELYLHGNLADTFFANLRAISRRKNICLTFVGGENMSYIMSRQGQRLNNFSKINLSYFSRKDEWSDFQLMIKVPSQDILNWHEEALSEVFNVTNGNPYYAKLVCAGIVRTAVTERDADVTAHEVKSAAESEVSSLGSNSFAHLWQDGIPRAADEREPEVLRRSRVLVAMARCLREPVPLTISNIAERKVSPDLTAAEIPAVLNDFQKREVLTEEEAGSYKFILPIFRMWLADVGATELVADSLSEELALLALAEENAAIVRSEEVVNLAKSWPTYRGKHIGTDDIRAWYQQVPSAVDQRILFDLLKKLRVLSEVYVRERLKTAHSFVRSAVPVPITRKKNERRTDILITYVDGVGKSGAVYASLYAEENNIAAHCVLSPETFKEHFELHVEKHGDVTAVVVVDDIAATGKSLAENIADFAKDNASHLQNIKLRAICLVATPGAQERITKRLAKIEEIDAEFRACEILGNESMAFPDDKSGWGSAEGWDRARALCVQLGSRIYKQSPLGFGGMGLLVVFPTTVPNNSLPILHSQSKGANGESWTPLFLRKVH